MDRCAKCQGLAPKVVERYDNLPERRPSRPRREPDRLAKAESGATSVDIAQPYFDGIWRLIGSSPTRYVQQTVVFCGDWPYSADALSRLLPPLCRWYVQEEVPEQSVAHTVIVGQRNASRDVMEQLLEEADVRLVTLPRFIPQEGFLDEILFGHDWWSAYPDLLNMALSYHEGLRIAHDLHVGEPPFRWPGVEADEAGTANGSDGDGFAPETPLHKLGYRITGATRAGRWHVLTSVALPQLGLYEVVQTIANHIRLRKAHHDGRQRFRHAIGEWEHDLARLKSEYWLPLAQRFPWPSVEPD